MRKKRVRKREIGNENADMPPNYNETSGREIPSGKVSSAAQVHATHVFVGQQFRTGVGETIVTEFKRITAIG